jgi:hypothetical protein
MTKENTTKAQCQARTADGDPCRMRPTKTGYCFNHDPEMAAARALSRKRGGESRHTPHAGDPSTIPANIQSIQEARQVLNYVLLELLVMDNSIPRARALLTAFEMFVRSLEIGELEQRIAALEARGK